MVEGLGLRLSTVRGVEICLERNSRHYEVLWVLVHSHYQKFLLLHTPTPTKPKVQADHPIQRTLVAYPSLWCGTRIREARICEGLLLKLWFGY